MKQILFAAAACLPALLGSPASAQIDVGEEQRCVWRCLADSPGAASRQYNDCVERMCVAPKPAAPKPAAPRADAWRHSGNRGAAQMASVTVGASTLAYVCQRGKPGVIGVSGLPGPDSAVQVTVDGRAIGARFATQGGTHYTVAGPGSALIGALLAGNSAQFRNPAGRSSSTFPLAGSGAAIRAAMAGCGLAP